MLEFELRNYLKIVFFDLIFINSISNLLSMKTSKLPFLFFIIVSVALTMCTNENSIKTSTIDQKVDSLLSVMTFPKSVGQIPLYYNHKNTGRPVEPTPQMVFWSHYQDESNDPLYHFGHGLSYTTFSYENIKLSANSFKKGGSIDVSFTLTNTGEYEGREVAQLYIRDLFGSVTRPVKELKGFELVTLQPGESKEVSFTIDDKLLEFYTANRKFESETGDFQVFIGGSSETTLEASFSLIE